MEFIDVLENVPKDKFRATANKLLYILDNVH